MSAPLPNLFHLGTARPGDRRRSGRAWPCPGPVPGRGLGAPGGRDAPGCGRGGTIAMGGGRVSPSLDLTCTSQCRNWPNGRRAFGPPDILVNAAGCIPGRPGSRYRPWKAGNRPWPHLTMPFFLARELVPAMQERRFGGSSTGLRQRWGLPEESPTAPPRAASSSAPGPWLGPGRGRKRHHRQRPGPGFFPPLSAPPSR
jgi:hypothetical protein